MTVHHYQINETMKGINVEEVYCELGQAIINLVGVNEDTKNVLLDIIDRIAVLKHEIDGIGNDET